MSDETPKTFGQALRTAMENFYGAAIPDGIVGPDYSFFTERARCFCENTNPDEFDVNGIHILSGTAVYNSDRQLRNGL